MSRNRMIMAAALMVAGSGLGCSPIHAPGFNIPFGPDRARLTPITDKKRVTFKPGKNRPKCIQRAKGRK